MSTLIKTKIQTGKIYEQQNGRQRKRPVEMLKGVRMPIGLQSLLMHVVRGKTLTQISKDTGIPLKTLDNTYYRGRRRLGCKTKEQLVFIAIKEGFIL